LFPDCDDPPPPPANGVLVGVNQDPDSTGTFSFGAIATYQCNDNALPQGSSAVVCLTTGLWEDLTLTCTEGKKMKNIYHEIKGLFIICQKNLSHKVF